MSNTLLKKGFTIVELLIALSLTALVGAIAVPVYSNLFVGSQINDASSNILQALRVSQTKSRARLYGASFGVYFDVDGEIDSYTLYQGDSYDSRNIDSDRVYTLDSSFKIVTTITGGDVHFAPGTGVPNETGVISVLHSNGEVRQIDINSVGKLDEL